jgi:DNA ligase-1
LIDRRRVVLDGEVAYVNPETGAVEFETVMDRFMMRKEERIRAGTARLPVHYFIFAVLKYDGQDVRSWPLTDRNNFSTSS